MELLSRYSNRDDLLKPLVRVLEEIESGPVVAEEPAELVSADEAGPRRLSDRLTAEGVQQLISSYLAGATIRGLAEEYGVGTSTVKRLLRRHGVRKRPNRAA